MGGQGIERRTILRYIGIASVASTFPGFSQWAFACAQDHAEMSAPKPASGPYQPLFFSPQQYRMVEHLAEMIIPEDDTPGAKTAGVAEFIDFMVANRVPVSGSRDVRSTQDAIEMGEEAQNRFLSGLDWMNARSKSEFGHEFMDCTPEQQNSLLEELAYKAKFKPTTESGRAFLPIHAGLHRRRLLHDESWTGEYRLSRTCEVCGRKCQGARIGMIRNTHIFANRRAK